MLYKVALCEAVALDQDPSSQDKLPMIKTASGRVIIEPGSEKARLIEAEIKKHPTALFFRAKAIVADEPNSNGDYFSGKELVKSYKSFEGVPFFTNHDNQNIENARGKIVFAEWIPEEKAIYTIAFVDREAFPHICRSIEEEYTTGVSMGAVSGGTMILLPDLTEKPIEDINEGDIVLSHAGIPRKVKSVHNEYLGKPMYKLNVSTYHRSPLFTDDHPVLTIDKEAIFSERKVAVKAAQCNQRERRMEKTEDFVGQDVWRSSKYDPKFKQVSCLSDNDYVLIPSKFNLQDGESSKSDFYYLVGVFLGDGYLKKDRKGNFEAISFCIGKDEIELCAKIHSLVKKFSNCEPHDFVCEERNGIYISVYDRKLAQWFYDCIGSGSKNKRIKLPIKFKEDAKQLLAGYLDTDGCIVNKINQNTRGNHFGGFQISSSNVGLLEDAQQLLISLGFISRISTFARTPSKNSVVNVDTIENTLAIGSNVSSVFSNSIKYSNSPFGSAEIKAGKSFITYIDESPFMACPVKSIEIKEFQEPVYDLTVEGDESYIADGIAIHNCSVEYSVCNICGNKAEKTEDYCFVPGTTITMSDLSVKNIEDINNGDEVLDAFGYPSRVTKTFVHDVDEVVQKITSKAINGELICTSNHPILVERRGELRFTSCEHLQEKEVLFTPIAKINVDNSLFDILPKYSIEDTEQNRFKLSKLIGYFIAEGCILRQKDRGDIGLELAFHSNETEYINEVVEICETVINKTPEIIEDRSKEERGGQSKQIRIYNKFIVELINNACLGLAKQKTLSKKVLSLDKKYLQEILAGYIDGDGHSDKYGRLILTTASRNLAHQLMYICNMFGIPPSIYSYLQNGGPNNREKKEFEIFRVSVANLQTLPLKNSSLKAQKSTSIAKTNSNVSRLKNAFSTNGFVKHSAYDIEELEYKGPVYNLETESHSFVANNTSVHNCAHIRNRKGRTFSGKVKDVVTGEIKEFKNQAVFEYNYGIKFIELSAVVDPACATCHIKGIFNNTDYLSKLANVQNSLYMIKTAALQKEASQEEVTQLEEVLSTLESIAVNLIQNRQQVEVEFASDLVSILSDLQKFVDELIGAGYANVQSVPGTVEEPIPELGGVPEVPLEGGMPPVEGQPAGVTPVAEQVPVAATPGMPGSITGSPTKPLVSTPQLPITAPKKPMAFNDSKLTRISEINTIASSLRDKLYNAGEEDMLKRRTRSEKREQKKVAMEVLSNSWKEKQAFFEYVKKVPSLQDNDNKISVKKSNDNFIIVAENKNENNVSPITKVWTYEDLNEEQRRLIQESPHEAAVSLLNTFANRFNNQKEGVNIMTDQTKQAGANSVNKDPEVITEAQLEAGRDLYHGREDNERNVITEKQLDQDAGSHKRTGEPEVITEAQLAAKSNKLHPRTEAEVEVITEAQLEIDSGVSPRTDDEKNVITQKQLDPNRAGEQEVITEKQLDNVAAPWERSAQRDAAMFKSAGEHMEAVISALANSVIRTGATASEVSDVASSLIDSTKGRFELENAILETDQDADVEYEKRLAFWSGKNVKVASVGMKEIAESIIRELRKVASDATINPEVIIDAIDVITEAQEGSESISKKVDIKLAAAQKSSIKANKKAELKTALKDALSGSSKASRDGDRKDIVASLDKDEALTREAERELLGKKLEANKGSQPDTMIEVDFDELGCKREDPNFRSALKGFARGALASQNVRLAAITNVTINGDTIQIAVQTDEGESVEIPIGEEMGPLDEEIVPEGDLSGEALEGTLPPAGPALASSDKKLKRKAQVPMGGGVPQTPGDVAGGPGSPEAGLPTGVPADAPVQALTTEEGIDVSDEIPTAGKKQMPYAICPECGSSDTDIQKEAHGNIEGQCNKCGAEYEALVKKSIEFTIVKPSKSEGEEGIESPESPEVPALPVASQTKLDKNSLVRIASNRNKFGHVCPSCGMSQCKVASEQGGHVEYLCPACGTEVQKDVVVNVNNPDENYLRVKWEIAPDIEQCAGCEESVKRFSSILKVEKIMKAAKSIADFPMTNCIERIARKYGGNSVASFGPCKGKPLADCVCGQLEKLGLRTVRHMERLAEVCVQSDPIDECLEDQKKKGFDVKEATVICNCLKKKFASEEDDNVFIQAFKSDIESGKEKILTAQDLGVLRDVMEDAVKDDVVVDEYEDIDIGADLPSPEENGEEEVVTLEISKETAQELADAVEVAVEVDIVDEGIVDEGVVDEGIVDEGALGAVPELDSATEEIAVSAGSEIDNKENSAEEKEMVEAMKTHKLRRVGEEVVKIAATPKLVKDIEGDVRAGVPRAKATMGEEGADNIDVPMAKPSVPRARAEMGHEGADNINPPAGLPNVAVDSSYMGVNEKSNQSAMPPINNEIKGTVIAEDAKTVTKEAKKLKEVETVEGDVRAGVPRAKATMGEEGADNIDVPMAKPSVPRAKATMGEEGADNIDVPAGAPDVPVDSAYMGVEKQVQSDMPAINDEYLKQVQQKKDVQLERISSARRMKAVEVTAKLLATSRIPEGAYDNVIEALSKFEIDKISSVADSMYPKKIQASRQAAAEIGHSLPAIVMESKPQSEGIETFASKLGKHFTIGSKGFDEDLTRYGVK